MKKLTLLIAALLLVGATAFAADLEVATSATLSGEASVTWGYDLDTGDHGFTNAASADVTVTFVPKASHDNGSDAEVYGWIEIKDVEVKLDDDDGAVTAHGDVNAKIVLGPAYVNITSADNDLDYAGAFYTPFGGFTVEIGTLTWDSDLTINPAEDHNGIAIGVELDSLLTFEGGVTSKSDWTDNGESNYNFYAAFSLTAVEGLTLKAKLNSEGITETMGVGAQAGYELSLGDYALAVLAGLDVNLGNDDVAQSTEIGAGVNFAFPGSDLADQDWFGYEDLDFNTGISVGFATLAVEDVDDAVTFISIALYDAELIPVIDLAAFVNLSSIGEDFSATTIGARTWADFGVAAPFAEFVTKNVDFPDPFVDTEELKVTIGTDIKVIDNTTFTAKWESGNLAGDEPKSGK